MNPVDNYRIHVALMAALEKATKIAKLEHADIEDTLRRLKYRAKMTRSPKRMDALYAWLEDLADREDENQLVMRAILTALDAETMPAFMRLRDTN